MIKYISNPDIFLSQADALVNPVNCKGVMGKGLALEFKKRFPECVPPYKSAVESGKFVPGVLLYVQLRIQPDLFGFKRPGIILFPTKNHWKDPSRLEWIAKGLGFLRDHYQVWGLSSVALPQLGCGLGGLKWQDVQPLFEDYLGSEPLEAEVYLNIERYEKLANQEQKARTDSVNTPLFETNNLESKNDAPLAPFTDPIASRTPETPPSDPLP